MGMLHNISLIAQSVEIIGASTQYVEEACTIPLGEVPAAVILSKVYI